MSSSIDWWRALCGLALVALVAVTPTRVWGSLANCDQAGREEPTPVAEDVAASTAEGDPGWQQALTAPLPRVDPNRLLPMSLSYDTRLVIGDREVSSRSSVEMARITEGARTIWLVREEEKEISVGGQRPPTEGAPATVTRRRMWTVDPLLLLPLQLSLTEPGLQLQLRYTLSVVSGEQVVAGETLQLEQDLPGPVVGEGAVLDLFVSALGLEVGDSTTIRSFAARQQQVRLWRVRALRKEKVTTPVAEHEAVVVELRARDGEGDDGDEERLTLWISTEAPYQVVRRRQLLSTEQGRATLTSELLRVEFSPPVR